MSTKEKYTPPASIPTFLTLESVLTVIAAAVVPGCAILSYYMMHVKNGSQAKQFISWVIETDSMSQATVSVMVFYAIVILLGLLAFTHKHLSARMPWLAGRKFFFRNYFTFSFSLESLIAWSVVFVFQLWMFIAWLKYFKFNAATNFWRPVFRALGTASAVQIGLTFLPLSRHGFLPRVLGMNFVDGPLSFHRVSGVISIVLGLLHFVAFLLSMFLTKSYPAAKTLVLRLLFMINATPSLGAAVGITGLISVVLYVWGWATSLHWFRRRYYNWFYINHFIMIPATIAGAIHADPVFYCVLPGLILYSLDGFYRLFTSGHYTIKELSVEPNGYVKVVLAGYNHTYKPGQYVQLSLPWLSVYQGHPFTIASRANDPELVMFVRPTPNKKTSWTYRLLHSVEEVKQKYGPGKLFARVSRPLGNAEPSAVSIKSLESSDLILVLVGGCGVAGGLGVASTALQVKHAQHQFTSGLVGGTPKSMDTARASSKDGKESRGHSHDDADVWGSGWTEDRKRQTSPDSQRSLETPRTAHSSPAPLNHPFTPTTTGPQPPIRFIWISRDPTSQLTSTYQELLTRPGADTLLEAKVIVDGPEVSCSVTHDHDHSLFAGAEDAKKDDSTAPANNENMVDIETLIDDEVAMLSLDPYMAPQTLSVYICGPRSFTEVAMKALQEHKGKGQAISVFSEGYIM